MSFKNLYIYRNVYRNSYRSTSLGRKKINLKWDCNDALQPNPQRERWRAEPFTYTQDYHQAWDMEC